jgi:hypothetical protein
MPETNEPLDRLIAETLNSIHDRALQDGLANSYRTLDNVGSKKTFASRQVARISKRCHSLVAVAASILLIVAIGSPLFNSALGGTNNSENNRIQSGSKIATATTTKNDSDPGSDTNSNGDATTTSAPLVIGEDGLPVTTSQSPSNSGTTPFISTPSPSPSPSTTTPANVLQYARVSYSNTRANSIPLEGATISGNVYIFYDDPNIFSVTWWLDKPGVSDKNEAYSAGEKQPQDFNYRIDGVTPRPYDTSQLTVGEHTMGIRTRTFSDQYTRYEIKFYVTR